MQLKSLSVVSCVTEQGFCFGAVVVRALRMRRLRLRKSALDGPQFRALAPAAILALHPQVCTFCHAHVPLDQQIWGILVALGFFINAMR